MGAITHVYNVNYLAAHFYPSPIITTTLWKMKAQLSSGNVARFL